MRQLVCCSCIVFLLGIYSEKSYSITENSNGFITQAHSKTAETTNTASQTSSKLSASPQTSDPFLPSASDFCGPSVAVGVYLGSQRTDVDVNEHFDGSSVSSYAGQWGGVVSVGYQHNIVGNFSVGVELGADVGSVSKSVPMGGRLRANSSISMACVRNCNEILGQMLRNISTNMDPNRYFLGGGSACILDRGVYSNFVRSMRHLGGSTNENLPRTISEFLTSQDTVTPTGERGPFYLDDLGAPVVNANARFIGFIGNNALNNVTTLGNGNTLDGYMAMRAFISANFPHLSAAMRNLAIDEMDVVARGPQVDEDGNCIGGTVHDSTMNIHNAISNTISVFFRGGHSSVVYLGIPAGTVTSDGTPLNLNTVAEEINSINNPDYTNNNYMLPENMLQLFGGEFKSKATFGVCPYIAVKFGYFVPEISCQVYFKAGFTQIRGHVDTSNDLFSVRNKFSKVTPMFALGVSKMLDTKYGLSIEFSHALKTRKHFDDIKIFNQTVPNRASITKNTLRILLSYKL